MTNQIRFAHVIWPLLTVVLLVLFIMHSNNIGNKQEPPSLRYSKLLERPLDFSKSKAAVNIKCTDSTLHHGISVDSKRRKRSLTRQRGKSKAAVNIKCTDSDLKREGFIKEAEYNKTVTIPNNERLQKLTHEEAATLFHRITQSIQIKCDVQIRLGNIGDGGYDVCEDQRPRQPCLVYSFGIRNDFSFDDDVAKRYGCEVHSFDPGMNKKSFKRSEKVFFHDTGIAGKDSTTGNWRLRRLSSIRKELNHSDRKIDILKIDTEGAEWDALIDMHQTGELGKIPQILVEFHLRTIPPVAKMAEFTTESYLRALSIIREMNSIGYKIFYNRQTHNCAFISKCSQMRRTNCVDVGFILRN